MNSKPLSHILSEYGLLSAEQEILADIYPSSRNQSANNAIDHLADEPVVQFVNQLLLDAEKQNVSDIHLEIFSNHCRVRFRHDGLLRETTTLPHAFATRIITRLKIMANLDITEKRLPQDGRIHMQAPVNIDLRISTCPVLHGENLVCRLLQPAASQITLQDLGMTSQQHQQLTHALSQPQGLILVTGPTGSGKTATLYATLQHLNHPEKNILTVEDPVEIEMNGIKQVNVNTRIGLTFAAVLRAFLRQDPDIMMIGEIRDAETAAIAVQAAQTGHLVLSTLHTNHAADTIKRLLTLGISSAELASSLLLLAAQRLVRKICLHCQASGCDRCHHGYHGRTGIFEMIPISNDTAELLLAKASLATLAQQFKHEQYASLLVNGQMKVAAGLTSTSELTRVLGQTE